MSDLLDSADDIHEGEPVLPITDEEIEDIRDDNVVTINGSTISKCGIGNSGFADWFVGPTVLSHLDDGKPARLNGAGVEDEVLLPADAAGTPKSDEYVAERLFERFREEEGRARQVAQEALHLLGYEVEKEYSLVEKDDDGER